MAGSYLICSTPRSGSTLLSHALEQMNIGKPQEYFNRDFMVEQGTAQGYLVDAKMNLGRYLRFIREDFSVGGWFGCKVHYDQLLGVYSFTEIQELVEESKLIWLVRDDLVAQAVSMYIARESGRWVQSETDMSDSSKTSRGVSYSHLQLEWTFRNLAAANSGWHQLFSVLGAHPLILHYEELATNLTLAVGRVLRLLGIEWPEERRNVRPSLQRQAEGETVGFVQRFRLESEDAVRKQAQARRVKSPVLELI